MKCWLIYRVVSQRQWVSALLHKTLLRVIHGLFVYKRITLVLTSSCYVCWNSNKILWLFWLNKKERSFMSLAGYQCPLRGENKLLLEQENSDSMLKSISNWSPASILNLKMWILKMRALQVWIFEILHFKTGKWTEKKLASPKEYTLPPLHLKPNFGLNFWPSKIFSWALPLLDVRHCCKLSLNATSRNTNEPNLRKWKKS